MGAGSQHPDGPGCARDEIPPTPMMGVRKDVSALALCGCLRHRRAALGVTPRSGCGTRVSHCAFLGHLLAQRPSELALGRATGEGNRDVGSHLMLLGPLFSTAPLHPCLSPYLQKKNK